VPASTAAAELYPRLARDPGWLAREHMELLGATGGDLRAALAAGRARLRQQPGADNALGRIKFSMPNPHAVYLHDTPARALFARTERAFSHGCIRLERPLELAQWALGPAGWDRARIEAAIAEGRNRSVPLAAPIPVLIFYATAVPGPDGRARFLPDVYGLDARLERALDAQRSPAAHAPGIQVHEPLAQVAADAAGAQFARRVAQVGERHVGESHVDRAPLQVKARARDTAASGPSQHLVGARRAIA
jgi:murein L,D-transpeptidase YcbB/YkuD